MKTLRLLAVLTPVLFCSVVFAQHQHIGGTSANVIDGTMHPELVPDSVAYRLYFVTVSEMPTPSGEARSRQLAYLKTIGLADADLQNLIKTLENFKVQYSDLIVKYNEIAQAAQSVGSQPDLDSFLLQRDGLVQATRDELKHAISSNGMALLDAYVQAEKACGACGATWTRAAQLPALTLLGRC